MRRGTSPAGRAGFTLIELLVVVAILALLAALVAAGIGRVREGTQSSVTNQSLTKLQPAINNVWKVTCDKCRDDRRTWNGSSRQPKEFGDLVEICDKDQERAEALWMFMHLRRAMPESFAEARAGVTVTRAGFTPVSLQANTAFKEIQNNPVLAGQPEEESAALLYIILGQGARGSAFAIDDAMQGAQTSLTFKGGATGDVTLPAFKDGFGTYFAFRRFYQGSDLWDNPEYGRARDAKMLNGNQPIDDPLDTVGRLALWKPPGTTKTDAEKAVGATFNGRNRIATAISAGVDSRDQPDGQKHLAFRAPNADDNAFGFRVMSGKKGD